MGLVREAARAPSGPTYGAVFFEPAPEAGVVVGLDLGARFLRGALCDLNGDVRARQDVELDATDAEGVLALARLHRRLVDASRLPGGADRQRRDRDPRRCRLGERQGHPRDERARARGPPLPPRGRGAARAPVMLENDVNLAAVGEQWAGIARGVDDFVFISIGTGLGSGVVLHGEIHRGRNGAAGELDYARAG